MAVGKRGTRASSGAAKKPRRPSKAEQSYGEYCRLVEQATSYDTGRYTDLGLLLQACADAWPCIPDALKFRAKNADAAVSLFPMHAVWSYAPPLFEHEWLLKLEAFIGSTRALKRSEQQDLPTMATQAIEREELARRLWNRLKSAPGIAERKLLQGSGAQVGEGTAVLKVWLKYGVVLRRSDERGSALFLATDMTATSIAFCHTCSIKVRARKEQLFREVACPRCGQRGFLFVEPG